MEPRELEQIQRAIDVCFRIEQWLCKRRPHTSACGEMDYAVKSPASKYFLQCSEIADVNFVQIVFQVCQVPACVLAFDRGIIEIVEVIDDVDVPIPFSEQPIDKTRANESRTAGDECFIDDSESVQFQQSAGNQQSVNLRSTDLLTTDY